MIDIADLDVVFLSYKEPNKEHNWADLRSKCPWAKRVDGVVGSDAAHKAAGEASSTERFILVDGDNIVDASLFDQQIDIDSMPSDAVIRWQALNSINGLKYGNGGVSSWTRKFVSEMKTHENSEGDDQSLIEFCFHDQYVAVQECFSTSVINTTDKQAWMAGFREGVKMSLNQGSRVSPANFLKDIWRANLRNLCIWMSVGADVKNGLWAMYGATQGCTWTTLSEWDHAQTRDFEQLDLIWDQTKIGENDLGESIIRMHTDLNYHLGLNVALLDKDQSKFIKFINTCPAIT
mgnify:FL=1|tara:strand:+ start:339 stop:1211 length:873 start_codon:yes stop_codon:yes gene_type:complete